MNTAQGIFCVGVDHHSTPLRVREVLASLAGERWIQHLIEHEGAAEVVFLSTCNRVEIYGRSEKRGPEITSCLARSMPADLRRAWEDARGVYLHEGIACWRHLAEVASGLRSMVVGEGEILGQVRRAYSASRESGGTGKSMHALFQSALRAARAARAAAEFGKGDASVGRLAAEAMEEILGEKERRPLLLLGSGHTARSFALVEKEFGHHSLWISSRSEERASSLASELGAEVVPWSQWHKAVKDSAVVVSALAGGELPWDGSIDQGPDLLLDLGVPRTLTALGRAFPKAMWVDLEELARRSEVMPESLGSIHRAEEVLRKHETHFAMGRADGSPRAQAFEG
jgi:glutamyl-tRNA reductase